MDTQTDGRPHGHTLAWAHAHVCALGARTHERTQTGPMPPRPTSYLLARAHARAHARPPARQTGTRAYRLAPALLWAAPLSARPFAHTHARLPARHMRAYAFTHARMGAQAHMCTHTRTSAWAHELTLARLLS